MDQARAHGARRVPDAPEPWAPEPRAPWRRVAVPTEHGGWGLTLEPVLLGLLLVPSWAGAALGLAAFVAFVARTPLKVVLVDRRRQRRLDRTVLATRIVAAEALVLAVAGAVAAAAGDLRWLVPVGAAAPFVAIELWFDVRSRSRRLVPELAGALGIAAVAPAIILAGGGRPSEALAAWLVLAARAVSSIPFVRVQVARLHGAVAPIASSDVAQAAGWAAAGLAVLVEPAVVCGAAAVALVAVAQFVGVRRPPVPAKVLGLRQMAVGLVIVVLTALGTWWW